MSFAIEMKDITKYFPGVVANDHVNLQVKNQEIHCLLGENGTGKTTLMNILFGLYQPNEGTIIINGQEINGHHPKDALKMGLGMIHQHFMLVDRLSVLENVILGFEVGDIHLDLKKNYLKVKALSDIYNFGLDLNSKVADLSVGMKQRVEILKTLYRGANTIIMDEPTAVLTPQEVDELLVILRGLKAQGKSIIFITHKLHETMAIADRITVLRKGKNVITLDRKDTNADDLAMYMVGRHVNLKQDYGTHEPGPCIMSYQGIRLHKKSKSPFNLDIRAGEIVGIAGVEGHGQMELEELTMGLMKCKEGRILLKGQDITHDSTLARKREKMGYIPSDRHKRAMFENFSISENMLLGYQWEPQFSNHGFLKLQALKDHTRQNIDRFSVKVNDPDQRIGDLSGGNQQKVILAREISQDPDFILAAQPSRGLDIGAVEFVHSRLINLRNADKAVLLISADLDEVLHLSDRVAVLFEGEIVALFNKGELKKEAVGLYMAGHQPGVQS